MKSSILFLAALLSACGCGGGAEGPDTILIVIDTFRADHVSMSGYGRSTTPCLDSLAGTGTVWTEFRSQTSWTLPAFATILTGLTPREHMAGCRTGAFFGLDPALPTIQGTFRSSGYTTAAFFNVVFLNEDFGFHCCFDHFDCSGFTNRAALRRAGETVDTFLGWLDSRESDDPYFAIVHFYDPHMPYDPPAPYSHLFTDSLYSGPYDSSWGRVTDLLAVNDGTDSIPPEGLSNLVALYDGEIAYSDAQLGRLLSGLRERSLGGSTVILVTGDHGEEFLEHGGIEHGMNLFDETLRVPLVASGPGIPEGVLDGSLSSQIDIFPTLCGLCGVPIPEGLAGRDLLSSGAVPRSFLASGILWAPADKACCVSDGMKVIWDSGTGIAQMFDMMRDAGETTPLPADSAILEEALAYWAVPASGRPTQVDFAETVDRALRDLGYIR